VRRVGDSQTLYFYVVRLSNRLRQHSACDVLGSNRVHSVRRRGNSADAAVPRQHRRRFRQVFSILLHAGFSARGACDRFIVRQYSIQYNYTVKCSSAQSTKTWPTVHYNVGEYVR